VQKTKWITVFAAWLVAAASLLAQAAPQAVGTRVADMKNDATLDALQEKRAFESLMKLVEKEITSTVDAMPADKFGFAPTDGEFKGVRTLG
jgi:hypothetical protein